MTLSKIGLLLLWSSAIQVLAFSTDLTNIQQAVLEMRYEEAQKLAQSFPVNPTEKPIAEYLVFHTYILQSLLEDPKPYLKNLSQHYQNITLLCAKLPDDNPYKTYLLGECDFELSLLQFQQKDYWAAVWNIKSAYKKLSESKSKHPNFYESYKSLGILHTMIGNLPRKFSWMASALGFKGDVHLGEREIQLCIQNANLQQPETQLVYAYMCMNIFLKRNQALLIATELPKQYPKSKYMACIGALICSKLSNDEAGKPFIQAMNGFKQGYFSFFFASYLTAEYYFHEHSLEKAKTMYQQSLLENKGLLFKTDALYKVGLCEELLGNRAQALIWYKKAALTEESGQEEDTQAQKNAFYLYQNKLSPIEIDLRIARNYADGGYGTLAIAQIAPYQQKLSQYAQDAQNEWYYRMARIEQQQKNNEQALNYYLFATKTLPIRTLWMKVYAWYYMGTIYETQLNFTEARKCYEKALLYEDYEYQNSLERRTKAALQRIKGKG